MKLFSMPGTCALSVHIVLEWTGVPFEVEVMNHGDNRLPAYLAVNPAGQVPALQLDDGTVLTEAAAILPFLAERYPQARLGSDDSALGRYRLAQLLSFLTGEVHVAFKPFFMPQRFLADEAQFAALKANAFVVLAPLLATLETRLGADSFILDNRRSVADAYLYILLRWVENAPDGVSPYPALSRFRARMETDPSIVRALAQQGMLPVG